MHRCDNIQISGYVFEKVVTVLCQLLNISGLICADWLQHGKEEFIFENLY